MPLPPALQPADEIWSELRRHLEWSAGFSLVFLFGRPRALAHVRSRLIEALRFRSLFLQIVAPTDANTAPEDVLNAVLRPPPGVDDNGAPVWIELDRSPDDPAWNQARSRVLALLNERRYLLERDVRRPMILALPVDYRRPLSRSLPICGTCAPSPPPWARRRRDPMGTSCPSSMNEKELLRRDRVGPRAHPCPPFSSGTESRETIPGGCRSRRAGLRSTKRKGRATSPVPIAWRAKLLTSLACECRTGTFPRVLPRES